MSDELDDATKARLDRELPPKIEKYVHSKGWSVRRSEDEQNWQVQVCCFCHNPKWNLEVDVRRGVFSCYACGEGGSFSRLKDLNGDKAFTVKKASAIEFVRDEGQVKKLTRKAERAYARIWRTPAVLDYARGRGFDDDTIDHFRLGAVVDGDDRMWLAIPHWVGDEVVNIKYRSVTGKKDFRQEKAAAKVLWNSNDLEGAKKVILVEGETKGAAVWQVGFRGAKSERGVAVVAMVLGAGVKRTDLGKKFPPEWVDALSKATEIYLCLDNDEAGKASAEKLAIRLGIERCKNIGSALTDAKDPDEWLFEKGHSADEFATILKRAKLMDLKNVVSVAGSLKRLATTLSTESETFRPATGWANVNRIFKPRPGNLIVVVARPKIGKSTLVLNLAHFWAVTQDDPCLFMCMEMSDEELGEKVACLHTRTEENVLDVLDVIGARYDLRTAPLYFTERVFTADPKEIFEAIRAAVKRYGIRNLIFDNLHFLARSEDKLREKIGVITQGFKMIAEELQITVYLVAHPRKNAKRGPITSDDLRESAAIHADADAVVVLHRERLDQSEGSQDDTDNPTDGDDLDDESGGILSPMTEFIVDAARRGKGGRALLLYDGARSWFREPTQEEKERWKDERRRNNERREAASHSGRGGGRSRVSEQ